MMAKNRKLNLESLQSRQVLAGDVLATLNAGQLYIEGTDGSNNIEIAQVGGFFQVAGVSGQFSTREVSSIRINALGGDDSIVAPQRLDRTSLISISIDGGAGNDKIIGSPMRDLIQGGDGNDLIYCGGGNDATGGGGGDDVINGEGGSDDLYGDSGRDHLYGNLGDDRLLGGDDSDYLDAGSGRDRVDGGQGDDTLRGGDDSDQLQGNNGDDLIYGGSGDDSIGGGSGKDVINGEEGDDSVYGDDGINSLYGNSGADRIFGKIGRDFMRGGVGLDRINSGGDDFEVFGVDDSDLRRGSTVGGRLGDNSAGIGSVNTVQRNKVEGTVTAVDLSNGQVTIQTRSGEKIVVTATATTKIERNDLHVALSAILIGDRGEALYGNDLVASKLEATSSGGDDSSSGSDDHGGKRGDDDDSSSGGTTNPARRNKVEGKVTVIDLTTNQVTIQTRSGMNILVTVTATTKIERNDRHVTLSAIRVGDRGEALYADGFTASKLESVGA